MGDEQGPESTVEERLAGLRAEVLDEIRERAERARDLTVRAKAAREELKASMRIAKSAGVTAEDLAAAAGVTRSVAGRWAAKFPEPRRRHPRGHGVSTRAGAAG